MPKQPMLSQCECGEAALTMLLALDAWMGYAESGEVMSPHDAALLDETFGILEQHCAADFGDLQGQIEAIKRGQRTAVDTRRQLLFSMRHSFTGCVKEARA